MDNPTAVLKSPPSKSNVRSAVQSEGVLIDFAEESKSAATANGHTQQSAYYNIPQPLAGTSTAKSTNIRG